MHPIQALSQHQPAQASASTHLQRSTSKWFWKHIKVENTLGFPSGAGQIVLDYREPHFQQTLQNLSIIIWWIQDTYILPCSTLCSNLRLLLHKHLRQSLQRTLYNCKISDHFELTRLLFLDSCLDRSDNIQRPRSFHLEKAPSSDQQTPSNQGDLPEIWTQS